MPSPSEMFDLLQKLWPALTGLASVAAVLAVVWLNRYFVSRKDFARHQVEIDRRLDAHARSLTNHDERLAALAGDIADIAGALAQLPRRDDLVNLELGVAEMRGGLRELTATVQALREAQERQDEKINMLTEHLLRG